LHSHQALIEKINDYAIRRLPFLLLTDFELQEPVLFLTEELEQENIHVAFPQFNTVREPSINGPVALQPKPASFEAYQHQFNIVRDHLQQGNSFLTNLTAETPVEINGTLHDVYQQAQARYKILYKDQWVCFSPESFIRIQDQTISSYPMKGTIDASLPNAEQILLNDPKEIAEHYTIVDLIRNDLSMVAKEVTVKKFRYIDRIQTNRKTLLQASSQIEGRLPDDYLPRLGDILFTLLPAGSISGAPKKKTVEIILEAERYKRRFYTGVAFYFDGASVDSCVLIRFIEKKPVSETSEFQMVYKSGGGITVSSEAEKEFQELIDKIYVPGI
jgi:para-aminobenzoate synthetase component 1